MEVIFDAWTIPAVLVKWWSPANIALTDVRIDPRPGGIYEVAGPPETFSSLYFQRGVVLEVVYPTRLVYNRNIDVSRPSRTTIITVRLARTDSGTIVTITHTFLENERIDYSYEHAWASALDRLMGYIEKALPSSNGRLFE